MGAPLVDGQPRRGATGAMFVAGESLRPKVHLGLAFRLVASNQGGCSGRAPLVVPVEAASFLDFHHFPALGRLHRSRIRAVHVQRPVTAPAMVVLEVADEDPPQVPLAEDDRSVFSSPTAGIEFPMCCQCAVSARFWMERDGTRRKRTEIDLCGIVKQMG